MRRPATLAVLLMIVVNTMAASCVSDTHEIRAARCPRVTTTALSHRNGAAIRGATGCGESVSRVPEQCRMRGFARTPIAAPAPADRLQVTKLAAAPIEAPHAPLD